MALDIVNVLIIKNIATEGPGTIEEYIRLERASYSIVDMSKGESEPDVSAFTHLVVLGGPMAVYETDRYPYLKREAKLIERTIKSGKSVLGICLGAQMAAHVLGARVYAGGKKEIGWDQVTITDEGMKDPLIASLAVAGTNRAQVFQWHGDTFDLPDGAVRLARSDLYPNQAFRYSDRVYALQFHIEVRPDIVLDWLKHEKAVDLNSAAAESNRIYDAYRIRAMNFYRGFFKSQLS